MLLVSADAITFHSTLSPPLVKVSEDSGTTWQDMPEWVGFFIRLGMEWPEYSNGGRRSIRLISMPCQSHGAALAALGAVSRDLADPVANDISRHFDGLLSYAEQYLSHCRPCKLTRCNPEFQRCGFRKEATGKVFTTNTKTRYTISPESSPKARRLMLLQGDVPVSFTDPKRFERLYPEGGIPLGEGLMGDAIDPKALIELCGSFSPFQENLKTSYSGLCYAGPPRGAAEVRRYNSSFKFNSGAEFALSDLLPISGWGSRSIPRLVYINTRGGDDIGFSHAPASPRLVIADGSKAFLRCIDNDTLAGANILAVIRRDERRENNEELASKLDSLLQWYERTTATRGVPRGVSVTDYIPIG